MSYNFYVCRDSSMEEERLTEGAIYLIDPDHIHGSVVHIDIQKRVSIPPVSMIAESFFAVFSRFSAWDQRDEFWNF